MRTTPTGSGSGWRGATWTSSSSTGVHSSRASPRCSCPRTSPGRRSCPSTARRSLWSCRPASLPGSAGLPVHGARRSLASSSAHSQRPSEGTATRPTSQLPLSWRIAARRSWSRLSATLSTRSSSGQDWEAPSSSSWVSSKKPRLAPLRTQPRRMRRCWKQPSWTPRQFLPCLFCRTLTMASGPCRTLRWRLQAFLARLPSSI
mmetsp:Transcript_89061/g.260291  ORF Transcript_89061/g.260291 Transcript_89061/m.260291 type:complete len:203 (+) Transcript_89061:579-1187(+)